MCVCVCVCGAGAVKGTSHVPSSRSPCGDAVARGRYGPVSVQVVVYVRWGALFQHEESAAPQCGVVSKHAEKCHACGQQKGRRRC